MRQQLHFRIWQTCIPSRIAYAYVNHNIQSLSSALSCQPACFPHPVHYLIFFKNPFWCLAFILGSQDKKCQPKSLWANVCMMKWTSWRRKQTKQNNRAEVFVSKQLSWLSQFSHDWEGTKHSESKVVPMDHGILERHFCFNPSQNFFKLLAEKVPGKNACDHKFTLEIRSWKFEKSCSASSMESNVWITKFQAQIILIIFGLNAKWCPKERPKKYRWGWGWTVELENEPVRMQISSCLTI